MITAPNETGTHLEREIREQPDVLARFIEQGSDEVARIADALRRTDIGTVLIAARGSSDNAARYAQYLIGERLKVPVALAAPSLESLYHANAVPRDGHGVVIGISQSGRSPDVVSVIDAARACGAPTIAITNSPDSPLARSAQFTIPLLAGTERSLAATKTYSASLLAVACLVTAVQGDDLAGSDIRALPEQLQITVDNSFSSVARLDPYQAAAHVVVVGRGYNYSTAMEITLKIRELTATVAEGFSSADLMHGPIAAIAPDTPVLLVAASGPAQSSVLEAAATLRSRGARTIVIGNTPDAELKVPEQVPEWLSPILTVVPGQIVALRWAVIGGHRIDNPPSLSKVTETT